MIFVTVGSLEPFDRLIRAVDEWARLRGRRDVFAQVASSAYRPRYIDFTRFLDPAEFNRFVQGAQLIVAHAGMGSIISALDFGKHIVVMPRRAKFRETRNDHQVGTAQCFGAQGRLIVANDERELAERLDYALTLGDPRRMNTEPSPRLLATIHTFLEESLHQPALAPAESEEAEYTGVR